MVTQNSNSLEPSKEDLIEIQKAVDILYNTNKSEDENNASIPSTTTNTQSQSTGQGSEKGKVPTGELIQDFLISNFDFTYNEVSNKLDYRRKGGLNFEELTEFKMNSIWREMRIKGITITLKDLTQWIYSDITPTINPFLEYFEKLPKYNGGRDYIRELAETVEVLDVEREIWYDWLKKWLVAAFLCATKPDHINQTALIFVGPQGCGKTTWLQKLVPLELQDYYFGGTIKPNNKDTIIQLAECFVINMDELENLNRSDIGNLKEIITKKNIRIRRPFSRVIENMPRRASFVGSVNNVDFLNDPTGSRRFLIFEVTKIDYLHQIPIDMLYSQVAYLASENFQYWFDHQEIKEINLRNEKFKVINPEIEIVNDYFMRCMDSHAPDYKFTTTQVMTHLKDNVITGLRVSVRSIGMALKASNFHRKKVNGIWYWLLDKRES